MTDTVQSKTTQIFEAKQGTASMVLEVIDGEKAELRFDGLEIDPVLRLNGCELRFLDVVGLRLTGPVQRVVEIMENPPFDIG